MTDATIELSRCETCRTRFLPTDGGCPRCGSTDIRSYTSPALGTVLASTEMSNPPTGWTAPHRIALIELPESVRLIAIVDGPLPAPGTLVSVRPDGPVYRATSEPGA
jgi:uncharacterized OB-fold protein